MIVRSQPVLAHGQKLRCTRKVAVQYELSSMLYRPADRPELPLLAVTFASTTECGVDLGVGHFETHIEVLHRVPHRAGSKAPHRPVSIGTLGVVCQRHTGCQHSAASTAVDEQLLRIVRVLDFQVTGDPGGAQAWGPVMFERERAAPGLGQFEAVADTIRRAAPLANTASLKAPIEMPSSRCKATVVVGESNVLAGTFGKRDLTGEGVLGIPRHLQGHTGTDRPAPLVVRITADGGVGTAAGSRPQRLTVGVGVVATHRPDAGHP